MGRPGGWDSWARRSPASTTIQEGEVHRGPTGCGGFLERLSKRRVIHDDRGEGRGLRKRGTAMGLKLVDADFFVFASSSWAWLLQADTCTGI